MFDLILALTDEQLMRVAADYRPAENEWLDREEAVAAIPVGLQERIARAHVGALAARFPLTSEPPDGWVQFVYARTPEGDRQFVTWRIEAYGHEDGPAQVTGIRIWGGDFPTWLDWRFAWGAGTEPLDLGSGEVTGMIWQARNTLALVLPEIMAGSLVIVSRDR